MTKSVVIAVAMIVPEPTSVALISIGVGLFFLELLESISTRLDLSRRSC